jgi:hypothetical protein
MMEMSPSAAVIVVFIVLFTAIAGVFVGMRLVGRRLQDGKPPSRQVARLIPVRTSDTAEPQCPVSPWVSRSPQPEDSQGDAEQHDRSEMTALCRLLGLSRGGPPSRHASGSHQGD